MAQDYNARAREAETGGSLGLASQSSSIRELLKFLPQAHTFSSSPLLTEAFTSPTQFPTLELSYPPLANAKQVLATCGVMCPPVTDNHVADNPRHGFHGLNSSLISVKQREVILAPEKVKGQQSQAKVEPVLEDSLGPPFLYASLTYVAAQNPPAVPG